MVIPKACLLSGHMPLHLGERHDYPWREVILSALPIVDEFVLLVSETDEDGTLAAAKAFAAEHRKVRLIAHDWWNPARREFALADGTDMCIEACHGTFHLALQADEVIHENQYATLRGIAENGSWPWAMFGRLNFFGSFDLVNVNRDRWPCEVVRLGRRDLYPQLRSHGDATHLGIVRDYDAVLHPRLDARDLVQFWHYSYSRRPGSYLKRQKAMADLYRLPEDPRLVRCREAGHMDWFSVVPRSEFVPVPGPHPKVMHAWIEERREAVASGVLEDDR